MSVVFSNIEFSSMLSDGKVLDKNGNAKDPQQTKVIVGMSGGVDSSVSAYLLKEQGFQVEGLFMKNWEEDDNDEYCAAAEDLKDAQAVADKLGIELHTINFAAEYWDNVFEYFLAEYKAGRTPNPDIMCNKEIKFKAFLEFAAEELGADFIATGHYVQRRFQDGDTLQQQAAGAGQEQATGAGQEQAAGDSLQQQAAGAWQMLRGLDNNKDQSYFLYTLSSEHVGQTLFPIGHLEKSIVRDIAKEQGLITHDKKDSTGICFIGERKFKDFLGKFLPAQPGIIKTTEGEEIGKHDGLMYHTLGQRKGLYIGGTKNHGEAPWYVVDKDVENNELIVGQGADHPRLYSNGLIANQLDWVARKAPVTQGDTFKCVVKTRYRQQDIDCDVTIDDNNSCKVMFHQPQKAVTPGQSAVFYLGDVCLGGGIIESYIR